MEMQMLGEFLRGKMKEKGWAAHHLHKVTVQRDAIRWEERKKRAAIDGIEFSEKCEEGVSNTQINKILRNEVENPSPKLLRKLSDAIGIPYYGIMEAAGYLNPTEYIEEIVRERWEPILGEEFVKMVYEPSVLKILNELHSISSEKRESVQPMISTIISGMKHSGAEND